MIFWKYESAGNDFLLFENQRLASKKIITLCDRHYGFGADGVLLLQEGGEGKWRLEVYNADGSKAQMCGNGLKIVAYHLHRRFSHQTHFIIRLNKREYPVYASLKKVQIAVHFPKMIAQNDDAVVYNVGNIHRLFQRPFDNLTQETIAKNHPNENISFYQMIKENEVRLLTYERGVSFTLSCGSASLAVAMHLLSSNERIKMLTIHTDGGIYHVFKKNHHLVIDGKVHYIGKGEIGHEIS